MKFTCDKEDLYNACLISSRAVSPKSPVQALEGLKIEVSENEAVITGYDLKRAIYTTIDVSSDECGEILVNARFFTEMLRRMPSGNLSVSVDESSHTVNTVCGKAEYNFQSIDSDEYPELPVFDPLKSISLPQNILKDMINCTLFAVSKEENRPIYTGSLFEINGDELTIVSVDGYRLARRIEHVESGHLEDCSFVVPGFALSDVEKICADEDEPVIVSVGEKHISFTIGSTVVITRRLEGDFLNHRKSVPENFRFIVKVNRQELISVIDRVSLVLSEKNGNPVRLAVNDGSINCLCVTPLGKAEDMCICEGSGDGLEIGFNDRYLSDALKAAESDELELCFNTSSSPCVIRAADAEEEKFTYMILPVRLHA